MTATESKLNYFKSKLDELRRAEMDLKMKAGNFDKELKEWLKEQGLPEQFHMIELISHFHKQKSVEIIT